MRSQTVAVALSGGVDSSVTACLLKQQGYNVVGLTAKMTSDAGSEFVVEQARKVAESLDIPFYVYDACAIFREKVVDYFCNSYKSGETPNPCIMCNKYVKWGCLYDYAIEELKADYVATGHYAKIKCDNGIYRLYPANDEFKDQLYFLFLLSQEKLKRTMFPLAEYQKIFVKQIAADNNLPSKSSKESQDICFIKPPMTTKKYLNNLLECKKGYFVDKNSGKILGEHTGFWQYTIGQRKGIGIAAQEALYVVDIDALKNIVYVAYKDMLYSSSMELDNVSWCYEIEDSEFIAKVKIRYNMTAVTANVKKNGNKCKIEFKEPVSAVAKGQACVIYSHEDGHLMGGSFI